MIAHTGVIRERPTMLIALDRTDIGRLLTGTPVIARMTPHDPESSEVIIHFIESPQEANRYANDLLRGEKI